MARTLADVERDITIVAAYRGRRLQVIRDEIRRLQRDTVTLNKKADRELLALHRERQGLVPPDEPQAVRGPRKMTVAQMEASLVEPLPTFDNTT